jgi:site-specific recombinase XerD
MDKEDFINKATEKVIELYGADRYKQRQFQQELAILLRNCTIMETGTQIVTADINYFYYIQKFLACKTIQGVSEKTLMNYRQTILDFYKLIGNKDVKQITTDDIRYYIANGIKKRGWANTTADNSRRFLSSYFSWCVDEDIIVKNPIKKIKPIAKRESLRKPFTDTEIEKMREYLSESNTGIRDRAIMEMLLSTGCRVGEIQNIKLSDVNFVTREVFVIGKGNKERKVFLSEKAVYHIQKYLNEGRRNDNCEYLFQNHLNISGETNGVSRKKLQISGIEQTLRRMGRQLGIKVHPHKFRHTAATLALQRGMPIEQVQQMLGHTKIDTTLIYAKINTDDLKANHRKMF